MYFYCTDIFTMEHTKNFHVESLSNLCRLCNNLLKKNVNDKKFRKYDVVTNADIIFQTYGVCTKNDCADVHPPHICQKCKLSLSTTIRNRSQAMDKRKEHIQQVSHFNLFNQNLNINECKACCHRIRQKGIHLQ